MTNEIIMIAADKIHPNPQNPRQDVGDLTEMVESIKKNGIMQNLVVTRTEDGYMILIGHRRFAASQQAGLTELPCIVVDEKTAQEQMAIMLEENIQRVDLTPMEQAFGFQMMIDLGETEDSIAEKTGFSKTTIKRRLNVAKLDKNVLSDREKDGNFQLSLTDLYSLEQVESLEKRNEILAEATDSRDLVARAVRAANDEKKEKIKAKLIDLLEAFDIHEAPKGTVNDLWNGKWRTIKEFRLTDEVDEISFDEDYESGMTWYWVDKHYLLAVIEKVKKTKKEKTPEEKKADEEKAHKKYLNDKFKEIIQDGSDFVRGIAEGKIKEIPKAKHMLMLEKMWKIIQEYVSFGISRNYGIAFLGNMESSYGIKEEDEEKYGKMYDNLPIHTQMLALTMRQLSDKEITTYNGEYNDTTKEYFDAVMEILDAYGFSIDDEEKRSIISGEHEYFKKPKSKDEEDCDYEESDEEEIEATEELADAHEDEELEEDLAEEE